jgi:hypothetical protein
MTVIDRPSVLNKSHLTEEVTTSSACGLHVRATSDVDYRSTVCWVVPIDVHVDSVQVLIDFVTRLAS